MTLANRLAYNFPPTTYVPDSPHIMWATTGRSRLAIFGVKSSPRGLVNFQLLPSRSNDVGCHSGIASCRPTKNKHYPL